MRIPPFFSGVRALLTLARRNAAAQPLAILGIAILLSSPFTWTVTVLAVALVLASIVLSPMLALPHSLTSLGDLHAFLTQYQACRFEVISLDDYLKVLHSRITGDTDLQSYSDAEFAKRYLPDQARYFKNHLRLVAVSGAGNRDAVEPTVMVAFSNNEGAWIFVRDVPSRMTNLQHFQLLHEFGHAAFTGTFTEAIGSGGMIPLITAVPFVLLLMDWSPVHAVASLVVLSACGVITRATSRTIRSESRAFDEVFADVYALERVPPTWLSKFSAQKMARMLGTDGALSERNRQQRIETLAYNLKRRAEGLSIRTDDTLEMAYVRRTARLVALQDLLIIGGMAWIGHEATVTGLRVLLTCVLCILGCWMALAFASYPAAAAKQADERLGLAMLSERENKILRQAESGYAKGDAFRRRKSSV